MTAASIRQPPPRIADYFVVVGCTLADLAKLDTSSKERMRIHPIIHSRYPKFEHKEGKLPDGLALFCAPIGLFAILDDSPPPMTYFPFTLAMEDNEKTFAVCYTFYEPVTRSSLDFCLREAKEMEAADQSLDIPPHIPPPENSGDPPVVYLPKCLCVISHYPFFTPFKKFLHQLFTSSISHLPFPIERTIGSFMNEVPVPPRGQREVLVQIAKEDIVFRRAPANELPYIDFKMRLLFESLPIEAVLRLYCLVLFEQKIVLRSSHLAALSASCEAVCSFIFPMTWQHTCIPVLPESLLDIISAPAPFIVGIHSSFDFSLDDTEGEVTVFDLDKGTYEWPPTLDSLWYTFTNHKRFKKLEGKLKKTANVFDPQRKNPDIPFELPNVADPEASESDRFNEKETREEFFKFLVSTLRGYAICINPIINLEDQLAGGLETMFRKDDYLRNQKSNEVRDFVTQLYDTQSFAIFIEDCFLDPTRPEKRFLDEMMIKKDNDNKTFTKLDPTPFLDEKSFRIVGTVRVPEPDVSGLPPGKLWSYPHAFPFLDESLFSPPRRLIFDFPPPPSITPMSLPSAKTTSPSEQTVVSPSTASTSATGMTSPTASSSATAPKKQSGTMRLAKRASSSLFSSFSAVLASKKGLTDAKLLELINQSQELDFSLRMFKQLIQNGSMPSRCTLGALLKIYALERDYDGFFQCLEEFSNKVESADYTVEKKLQLLGRADTSKKRSCADV
eukprot:TRINITY_DN3695_c0_g1_i1.p1 TRINITY_DN3695_c0_g1~~TRINITY_DN3695_c0_g1_i1.p1  ORF type:complete len:729 (-),score=183.60 TRINITY_DN3695_c0_g1_i1:658-2844(-)